MHENSFLDVNTLVITRHAQERWKERGFRGTYGLLEELSKAQLFTEEVRGWILSSLSLCASRQCIMSAKKRENISSLIGLYLLYVNQR